MRNIQHKLDSALVYWLYRSISSVSFKEALFLHYSINRQPLAECFDAFQESGVPLGWDRSKLPQNNLSTIQFAKALSNYFQQWEQYSPKVGVVRSTMPKGQDYQNWLAMGGRDVRYKPVHMLRRLLERSGSEFFRRAIIHGSIATLDDTPGFSDMDLAFIVRASVLKDPDKLLELRELAARILLLTYAFDPFMHHGPYYISEIDLTWYPGALFPPVLFSYGVDLLDDSQELEIWIRPSDDVTDRMFDMFEIFFEQWPSDPFMLNDNYDIEWLLGSVMLLPALYLHRGTGEFRYKRDTFPLAEKDFTPEEWEPVRTATELRENLSNRPKTSRLLIRLARLMKWPGLLQRFARRRPISIARAQKVTKALGPDYPQRVLVLLRAMKGKILESPGKTVKKV